MAGKSADSYHKPCLPEQTSHRALCKFSRLTYQEYWTIYETSDFASSGKNKMLSSIASSLSSKGDSLPLA
jgi:hypothetical protein